MSSFFQRLRKTVFGPDGLSDVPTKMAKPEPTSRADRSKRTGTQKRPPYFFQIGFDFGTAFSKCIVRDIAKNRAYVYVSKTPAEPALPFLLPSVLDYENGLLYRYGGDTERGIRLGLLKMALVDAIRGQFGQPATKSLCELFDQEKIPDVERRATVSAVVAFFLAIKIRDVKRDIKKRFADFGEHPKDVVNINMAIPVAELSSDMIRSAFHSVLRCAWVGAEELGDRDSIELEAWVAIISRISRLVAHVEEDETCFVYPEVSANVQSFARSRSSKPGIYLFSDAGAGTVDQSIFILSRRKDEEERLIYLGAQVLPLGSALLELTAAARMSVVGRKAQALRQVKEAGSRHPFLDSARDEFASELSAKTLQLLATVKTEKLARSRQLEETELIFGGGGHVENPYERGVRDSFSAQIFALPIDPRAIGLPRSPDLEMPRGIASDLAARRLSVAYGLSFPSYEILPFTFPNAVKPAARVWQKRPSAIAPSKDVC